MISYGSAGVMAQVISVPPPANVKGLHSSFTERVLAESRGTRELKPGR